MKICLACGLRFDPNDFCCPACGHSPELHDGYPAFAPDLAVTSDGFRPSFFDVLAGVEADNFWFESRNRLLMWTLRRYFSNADNFLEIGCGSGFVLSGIRKELPNLVLSGSDVFSEGLAYAKARVPGVTLFQMDACNIPFDDEFDVIGAFDVLEHIQEDTIVLSQMFRATKGGGGIILTVPQHQWLWSIEDDAACHKRRYSRTELVAKVENAGFRIVWATSFVFLLFPLMVASRLRFGFGVRQENRFAELRLPSLLNAVLEKICDIERYFLMQGISFPVGGSLLCVGLKE